MEEQSTLAIHTLDERTANRVVRRVNELRRYIEHVEQWAASEIRRTQRQEERLMQWFRPGLQAWARERLGNGRRRSIALPGGSLGFRRQPVRPVVVNEVEAMAWCRAHLPAALRVQVAAEGDDALQLRQLLEGVECGVEVSEQVRIQVLAAHVKSSGQHPPGVSMGGGDERFFVR